MKLLDEIQKELERKSLSVLKFSNDIGIPAYRIYKWFDGKGNPKADDVKKLEEWLRIKIYSPNVMNELNVLNESSEENYLAKRRNQKNDPKPYMAPLMPVKAQAGYVKSHDQQAYVNNLEQYALPPGVDPTGAVWRYWEVDGDSMEPTFRTGDIILTSQVPRMDWEQLRNFYIYVIVTEDRVLVKRVFCKNELEWVLISDNEDQVAQQLLPAELVKEVWVFRRLIVNKVPPPKMFVINV